MSLILETIAALGTFAITIISSIGYVGLFFLMMLESMVAPIPSELVMPFAGFLVSDGTFSWVGVLIASSLGSIAGSLLSYYIGLYGGNKVVITYGKYLLLDVNDLMRTEEWFRKKGEYTIFIGRLIPVVRHLVSIPAGIGKMNLRKFCFYTVTGATIWNMFLAYLGYILGKNWSSVRHYTEPISIIVAILLVAGFAWFVYRHVGVSKDE